MYICVWLMGGIYVLHVHEHDFDQVCAYLIMSDDGLHRSFKTYMLGIYSEMYWERPLCS